MAVAVGAAWLLAFGLILSPVMWLVERRRARRDALRRAVLDRPTVDWPL